MPPRRRIYDEESEDEDVASGEYHDTHVESQALTL